MTNFFTIPLKKIKLILCTLALLLSATITLPTIGQTRIFGRIIDTDSIAIVGAIIKVNNSEGNTIAYGSTNSTGHYDISIPAGSGSLSVNYSSMSYKQVSITVADSTSRQIDITMEEAPLLLKEVTVKTPPVRAHGDTLVYNVDAFKNASDRNIEDVIKKLPGIEVMENGQIQYNGLDLNKFYIEGLDLLSGRYSIATKNISPDDIASVSIYENHQSKRVLEDVRFSEKAALNLTLKKRRMLKPIGYANIGAGLNDKMTWLGELFTMFISPKSQTITTAKGNNYGISYNDEMQQFINNSDESSSIATDIFPLYPLGTANIPTKRYFFNTSLCASINTIFKIKEGKTISAIADYTYEDNSYSNYTVTDYYVTDNERLYIAEQNHSNLNCHKFNIKLNFENNAPSFYINNNLNVNGMFNDNNYQASTDSDISQQLHSNDIKITNSFNTILRRNNKIFELSSDILIANTPQNYILAFDLERNNAIVNQSAKGLSFHSHEKTAFSWLTSNQSTIGVNLSFKSQYDRINTVLVRPSTDDIPNDNSGYKLITTAAPYYQYKSSSLTWRLDIPVNLYNINYTNAINCTNYHLNRPYIDINSSLYYNFPYNIKTALRIGQTYSIGNLSDFIINPIYTTYKQQSIIGSGSLQKAKRIYATFSARYRNTVEGLFLSSQATLSKTENNRFYSSIVNKDETVTTTTSGNNTSHIAFAALSATKNIYDWNTSFSLNCNAQFLKRHSQRQSAYLDIHNCIYNINPIINNSFLNNRIVSKIDCLYTISTQNVTSSSTKSKLNDFTATLNLSVFPIKAIEIYTKASYMDAEIEYNIRKKDLYLDAGIRFINSKWQIDMSINNITNRKSYSYSRFDEYDIYSYRFTLRPIECLLSFKYNY